MRKGFLGMFLQNSSVKEKCIIINKLYIYIYIVQLFRLYTLNLKKNQKGDLNIIMQFIIV